MVHRGGRRHPLSRALSSLLPNPARLVLIHLTRDQTQGLYLQAGVMVGGHGPDSAIAIVHSECSVSSLRLRIG